jgi:hypothetical protein
MITVNGLTAKSSKSLSMPMTFGVFEPFVSLSYLTSLSSSSFGLLVLFPQFSFLFVCIFETGSPYVAPAGLELVLQFSFNLSN